MLLVARHAIRRAHRAGVELAAVAVVVAHLDRFVETAPLAPVEHSADFLCRVARLETEQCAIVLPRRTHDLPRIEQPFGVEYILDFLERARELGTEKRCDPLRAHETVPVLP